MNNNNLKRRQPYSHEDDSAEPALQDPAASSSSSTAVAPSASSIDVASSFSSQQLYILREAAALAKTSVTAILQINHLQDPRYILRQAELLLQLQPNTLLQEFARRHKRPRLNSDVPMAAPQYSRSPIEQDVHEKSPLGQPSQAGVDGRRGFSGMSETGGNLLGWTGSRVADCFANFNICQPGSGYESDSGYNAVPVTTSYDYGGGRPLPVALASPANDHGHSSYISTTGHPEQPNLFACDDPSIVAQYMQSYPPMQPTRGAVEQPSTRREGMFYPDGLPDNAFFKPDVGSRDLGAPVVRSDPASMANRSSYSNDMMPMSTTPALNRHSSIGGQPPRYGVLPGYESSDAFVPDDRAVLPLQRGDSSLDVVFPNQKAPAAKRGPFKDHAERQRTAQTRKIGSCIRCRMQRIRCNSDPENEGGFCLGCKKVSSKIWRLPCMRLKISDVVISKTGQVEGHEWTLRWKENTVLDDIGNWASPDIKTIWVTEGYTSKPVELRVRRFVPQDGDRLDRSWVGPDGGRRSVRIPPYAIVDLDATRASYDGYIKNGLVECFKRLLGPREKLLWHTYTMAHKLSRDPQWAPKERELLSTTLELWMAIRLTTKSFEIVGNERLGMSEDVMAEAGSSKTPLPPVMGAQIDSVLINQIQQKLRHNALECLQKFTTENKQKTWLTTYLVVFIFLHNTALLFKHDAEYRRKHGIKRRFARDGKVQQYYQGAITFLAYFHYCNKGIFPFSEECKESELKNLAELDNTAVQFVGYTRNLAIDHKRQWQELWDGEDYDNDYYFISQLFEHNWQPRSMA